MDSGAAKAVVRSRVLDYAHGGDPVIIHFIFKWSCKTGTMYAGDPKQGGIPFANVSYSLPGVEKSAKGEYFLAVAPGVDKGICIALCIALADTQNC